MAHGEAVVAVYNERYDQNSPVVCIGKRPLNLNDHSQNTWVGNLRAEPKPKKKVNDTEKENNTDQDVNANLESKL